MDARRREFGLLRAAGATARQVFRLVLGEAFVVGVLAAVVGSALGAMLAPPVRAMAGRNGVRPERLHGPVRLLAGRCSVWGWAGRRVARRLAGGAPCRCSWRWQPSIRRTRSLWS
ncbi:ABC transporter permease [Frankia gtarii]|uniref:ABC transporter permease n=1 Tax=Frankia gtarii TaxID=2950102 RepID=UPI0027E1EF03|nr:ABC transporter permease [Frankia gtarii]